MCDFLTWIAAGHGSGGVGVTREYAQDGLPESVGEAIEAYAGGSDGKSVPSLFNWVRADDKDPHHRVAIPAGIVGAFPFRCDCGQTHLLIIGPKLAAQQQEDGRSPIADIANVCDLAAHARRFGGDAVRQPRWLHNATSDAMWNGDLHPPTVLWLFLAMQYVFNLEALLGRDFRRYYVTEQAVLKGRAKGKVLTSKYINRCLAGRPHEIPCRWQHFTFDNWDNRILETALRECRRIAGHSSAFADFVSAKLESGPFRMAFDEVTDVNPWEIEWARSRLAGVSSNYRDCLALADQILKSSGGAAPAPPLVGPVWIDTNQLFEDFVVSIVDKVASNSDLEAEVQDTSRRLFADETYRGWGPTTKPDAVLRHGRSVALVVDAKYKGLLDAADGADNIEQLVGSGLGDGVKDDRSIAMLKILTADMYQMYFYLSSRVCNQGLIVFPFWDATADRIGLRTDHKGKSYDFNAESGNKKSVAFLGLNMARIAREGPGVLFEDAVKVIGKFLPRPDSAIRETDLTAGRAS